MLFVAMLFLVCSASSWKSFIFNLAVRRQGIALFHRGEGYWAPGGAKGRRVWREGVPLAPMPTVTTTPPTTPPMRLPKATVPVHGGEIYSPLKFNPLRRVERKNHKLFLKKEQQRKALLKKRAPKKVKSPHEVGRGPVATPRDMDSKRAQRARRRVSLQIELWGMNNWELQGALGAQLPCADLVRAEINHRAVMTRRNIGATSPKVISYLDYRVLKDKMKAVNVAC